MYNAKVLGTGCSNRITVPTCLDDHVENARVCVNKLTKALNDIAKDDLRPQQALRETKAAILECRVELKRRSTSHKSIQGLQKRILECAIKIGVFSVCIMYLTILCVAM